MSILVSDVSKRYGAQPALSQVSFSIRKGEIVGFLGPNGAGKSTMMKIITGYLPPASGQVSVCGFDIATDGLASRRKIGYLPEHNPLYTDMYVREYLAFIAELYGLNRVRQRVEEMIDTVGLTQEAHKKIEELSKGYRQRVGLAQAMIHDPEVLILDEPTSGLDPNQLAEIRDLIVRIGQEKTVMLSTHIMQEVEAICSRTIIINKGQVVADRPTTELRTFGAGDSYELNVEFSGPVNQAQLLQLTGVLHVRATGTHGWTIEVSNAHDIRPELGRLAAERSLNILALARSEHRLEAVFKELTNSRQNPARG
ncbi:MAG: gliding motility-associated ABC transporter ATP-binding subunit GldA [Flavobacteriales bacterium]|jgi:ABC-2 type transport system ATP-binding protein